MAKVLFNSGNLLRHVRAHEALGADWIEFRIEAIRPGCGVLSSPTGRTELPIENGRNFLDKRAMLFVPNLLLALKSITCQPITLDLHEHGENLLFAGAYSEQVFAL